MFRMFYPDQWYVSSWSIDYKALYEAGYRGVIFDIDNTLAVHGGPPPQKTLELFAQLRALDMKVCVLSNNKEPRVRSFAEQVDCFYIHKAGKPSKKGYLRAMEQMGTHHGNTVFVGDQLFTDVYGARRTGIYSILVQPIDLHEEIQIVLKRYLEKIVLVFYKKQGGKLKKG